MTLRHPDFRPVSHKEMSVTGRTTDTARRPASTTKSTRRKILAASITTAVAKIETDFEGLKAFWDSLCRISSFHFVFNDKFQGGYPTVEAALLRVKAAHALTECAPFLVKDLMREIAELDERSLLRLVGSLPCPKILKTSTLACLPTS